MRLALIPPYSLLTFGGNTNYHLMLPQLTGSFWYRSLYTFRGLDQNQYVILDNGAAEGCTVTPNELTDIAERFKVDEVVLPDVMYDTLQTSVKVWEFMRAIEGSEHDYKLGLVATGRSGEEAYEFALGMVDQWPDKIDVLYLPRLLVTEEYPWRRLDLARNIHEVLPDLPIHFLGANSHFIEEMRYAGELDFLRGMDTSAPYNYAFAGEALDGGAKINRPDDYFTRSTDEFDLGLVQYNIDVARKWANGE
jgi:hypothetical protein